MSTKQHCFHKVSKHSFIQDEDPKIQDAVREDVELYKEIASLLGFKDEKILTIENPTSQQLLVFFDGYCFVPLFKKKKVYLQVSLQKVSGSVL